MRRRPDASVCLSYLIAILLKVGHELAEVSCRKILPGYNHGGCMRRQADWFEVTFGIVLNVRSKHWCSDMRSHAASQQGVAIRLRSSDARAAQCTPRASNILNDHLLAKRPTH